LFGEGGEGVEFAVGAGAGLEGAERVHDVTLEQERRDVVPEMQALHECRADGKEWRVRIYRFW
jgi:hypothetical protein